MYVGRDGVEQPEQPAADALRRAGELGREGVLHVRLGHRVRASLDLGRGGHEQAARHAARRRIARIARSRGMFGSGVEEN